jgi:hypothetical protein
MSKIALSLCISRNKKLIKIFKKTSSLERFSPFCKRVICANTLAYFVTRMNDKEKSFDIDVRMRCREIQIWTREGTRDNEMDISTARNDNLSTDISTGHFKL